MRLQKHYLYSILREKSGICKQKGLSDLLTMDLHRL